MVVFAGNIGGIRNIHHAGRLSDFCQSIRLRDGIHVQESYLMPTKGNGRYPFQIIPLREGGSAAFLNCFCIFPAPVVL